MPLRLDRTVIVRSKFILSRVDRRLEQTNRKLVRELQDFMETIRLWERERKKEENLKLIKEKDERFLPKKNENLGDPYFFFFLL